MTWPFGLLRRHGYGVIYADPPWGYETWSRGHVVPQKSTDPGEQHYPVMTTPDMAKLPVGQLAAPNCALLMWSTSSHTPQAFWLAEQWGFRFASKAFTWAKLNKNAEDRHRIDAMRWGEEPATDGFGDFPSIADSANWFMGMGHGTRRNTEDCWLFTRGNPKRIGKGVRELIVSPIREHSRKPDETYDRIERLFQGPHCELFARNSRPGWSSWGNETSKFD